jgi:hypothetical protein
MQALGMKLLTKKDVPDYKVPAVPSNFLDVVFFHISRLNIFGIIRYTIAKLGYAEEDKVTVLELIYNYGVSEYSKGNAYAQAFAIFYQQHFPINILAFFNCLAYVSAGCHWHQRCVQQC